VAHVSKEILFFFNEISIYLLFGFIVAGILYVFFPDPLYVVTSGVILFVLS